MVDVAKSQGWGGDAAEDIAQRAAVTALAIAREEPQRLEAVGDVYCRWMCGIAWNVGRAARTKRERRQRILQENSEEVRRTLNPEPQSPWTVSSQSRRVWDVAKRVLPPRQAEVIRLILEYEMNDAEVAVTLGISATTARWHRNEATKTLRHVFFEGIQ